MEDSVSDDLYEENNKDDKEDIKDSKSKKKKLSDLPIKEEEKEVKEPEVEVEEVPVNPMDAIMMQIASLEAEVGIQKTKKGKKSKKRKKTHDSDEDDEVEDKEDEPNRELEDKEEEDIALQGLGSLVTGYDSDELSEEETDFMKPEDLKPRIAPKLDDDFIFLKPKSVVPTNMIPQQLVNKREKVKKIGLYDRLALAQMGMKMEENGENTAVPTKTVDESSEPAYVYNPMSGRREKVGPKPPAFSKASSEIKEEESVNILSNNMSAASAKYSMMYNRYNNIQPDGKVEKVETGGNTEKIKAEPTTPVVQTPVEPAPPQYKFNPMTGYRDLLITDKPTGFTVGASKAKLGTDQFAMIVKDQEFQMNQRGKSICKYFNMKFGCRNGDNCHFLHEKVQHNKFNYVPMRNKKATDIGFMFREDIGDGRFNENGEDRFNENGEDRFNENVTDNGDGYVTKAPSLVGPSESKETEMSASELYKQFMQKNQKEKSKGAGIFFEKAKENPFPTNNHELTGKIDQSKQFDEHNGIKSKSNELKTIQSKIKEIENAKSKREENTKRAQKTKEIFKSHREGKEIVRDLLSEIIDTIFPARRFSNSKSRSRSNSLSLSSSSDEEVGKKNGKKLSKSQERKRDKEMKRQKRRNTIKNVRSNSRSRSNSTDRYPRSRSTSRSRKFRKSKSRGKTKERSRSRSRSLSTDRRHRSRSRSPEKSRRSPEKLKRRQKSRSRSRDKGLDVQSRPQTKPKVRVLSSSYLEQVRNGTTNEWNEEKYKNSRQEKIIKSEVKEEEYDPDYNKERKGRKRKSNGSEGKQSLQGLEEWLSIEKNKESPKTLNECIGIVTCILNENYAIAPVTLPNEKVSPNQRKGPFRVLFDTCEFWVETKTASDLSISLEQVISVGDYVKINAILIDKPNKRNITYMATATMTSSNIISLIKFNFVKGVAVNNIKEVSKSKLENFDVVVNFLSANPITEEEMQIEMKSEKDADCNLPFVAKNWKNPQWLMLYSEIIMKPTISDRGAARYGESERGAERYGESEKEYNRLGCKNSDEFDPFGMKSLDSRDKNGFSEKTSKRSKDPSSSPEDRYKKESSSGSRDKYGMNGSKERDRKKSRSRSPKMQHRKERDSRKKRSSRSPEKKKHGSRTQENEYKNKSSSRSHERRNSSDLKEKEYSRKNSSRSQENENGGRGPDRSSEKEHRRKRSRSRERKHAGERSRRSKEKELKRKLSTESPTSETGRELCSRLPSTFAYWNQNLIKCLDDGDYVDCVYCQETLATKPEHNFIPYYLDHYASPEHEQKLEQSSPRDQDCINDYIANSTELDYFIQLELERGAAEVIYDEGDLRLYMCKYCQKIGTTAWHFYKLKNSRHHQPENLPL